MQGVERKETLQIAKIERGIGRPLPEMADKHRQRENMTGQDAQGLDDSPAAHIPAKSSSANSQFLAKPGRINP